MCDYSLLDGSMTDVKSSCVRCRAVMASVLRRSFAVLIVLAARAVRTDNDMLSYQNQNNKIISLPNPAAYNRLHILQANNQTTTGRHN